MARVHLQALRQANVLVGGLYAEMDSVYPCRMSVMVKVIVKTAVMSYTVMLAVHVSLL